MPHSLVYQAALRLLANRNYSQHDLTKKLQAKGYAYDAVGSAITDLIQAGYLNDDRFAENYIHYRRQKGYGPKRIQLELQIRGITDATIAEHLNITDNSWQYEAQKVWLKHFKGQRPTHLKDKAKQVRFLQYRGFTQEQIEHILMQ